MEREWLSPLKSYIVCVLMFCFWKTVIGIQIVFPCEIIFFLNLVNVSFSLSTLVHISAAVIAFF